MFLIVMLGCASVGEGVVNADVIPKRVRVSTPNPVRKAVFLLVALHALEVVKLCGHLLLSSVSVKPSRVSNWHLILPASPEYEQLIRVCHAATGRVFAALAVSEAFHHCPVADGQRLFPDEVTVGKPPSVALMGADDVAGEINK
jgi:hypothetical protein